MAELDCDVTLGESDAVVRVAGAVDLYSAAVLREHLLDVIRSGHSRLIVDLERVTFIDSTGLGVLIGALKRARDAGGGMQVIGRGVEVDKVFRITGLYRILPLHASVQAARAAFAASADTPPVAATRR